MIVNLDRFLREERPHWDRLDACLRRMSDDPWRALSVEEARELERLYQRAAADLARLNTFAVAPEARDYLESLVSRGYAEIHGARAEGERFKVGRWFRLTLPRAWRRHARSFWLAFALMVGGALFGAGAVTFDPTAKSALMPFPHLRDTPTQRVAREERRGGEHMEGRQARFSGMLMTHNTRVSLMAMATGLTWGVGTLIIMFYNGVILGAVALDYILDGQTVFLLGWLLPHGATEIPAMLIGGQAGFVLAGAMLGRGQRASLSERFRRVVPDVVTLCFGAAVLLVWAGIIESFLSQYHEPVLPYAIKIAFGVVELAALIWYLGWCGRGRATTEGKP